MPKLWDATIESHRRAVRDAVLDAAAALVAAGGVRSVTMSEIAEHAGIGRATLYKYFPDVETILLAWHERQVGGHLRQLAEARELAGESERLEAVLETYALIVHGRRSHGGGELAAFVHADAHVARARKDLLAMIAELLAEEAGAGRVRNDASPEELASYCVHALAAAGELSSRAAVRRLVDLTLAAVRPSPGAAG